MNIYCFTANMHLFTFWSVPVTWRSLVLVQLASKKTQIEQPITRQKLRDLRTEKPEHVRCDLSKHSSSGAARCMRVRAPSERTDVGVEAWLFNSKP